MMVIVKSWKNTTEQACYNACIDLAPITNKEWLSSIDFALVEHCSPDIIGCGSSCGMPGIPNFCLWWSFSLKHPSCRTIWRHQSVWWTLDIAACNRKVTFFAQYVINVLIFATKWDVISKIIEIQGIQYAFRFNAGIFVCFIALIMLFSCIFQFFTRTFITFERIKIFIRNLVDLCQIISSTSPKILKQKF